MNCYVELVMRGWYIQSEVPREYQDPNYIHTKGWSQERIIVVWANDAISWIFIN